jgi:hypothetical protein
MNALQKQLSHILEQFRAGSLSEADLEKAIELAGGAGNGKRQSLLYLQAGSTHPYSPVIGISIYEEGRDIEALNEKGEFLYKTVRDALEDGWRVIKFPEMVLAMDDQNNYGLGYEFILERWR